MCSSADCVHLRSLVICLCQILDWISYDLGGFLFWSCTSTGLLVPDLPLEETDNLHEFTVANDLELVSRLQSNFPSLYLCMWWQLILLWMWDVTQPGPCLWPVLCQSNKKICARYNKEKLELDRRTAQKSPHWFFKRVEVSLRCRFSGLNQSRPSQGRSFFSQFLMDSY